jgi:S1-C subfamily serine protease
MVSHAYLGVTAEDPGALVSLDSEEKPGVEVQSVDPDGPAARAGILGSATVAGGDVITKMDGDAVRSMADVDEVVSRHRPGDGIAVELLRNGAKVTVQVQLGERPASVPLG